MPSFDDLMMESQRGITRGTNSNLYPIILGGEAPALGVSEVEIQPQADTILPSSAGTLSIVSDNANDTFGGSGLNVVLLQALDGDYGNGGLDRRLPFYEEIIPLNGTNAVDASIPLLRAQNVRTIVGNAVGIISITIGGVLQLILRPGDSSSRSLRLTLPRDWSGFVENWTFQWSAANPVRIDCRGSLGDGTILGNFEFDTNENNTAMRLGVNPLLPTSDVRCYAARTSGGGTDNLDAIIPAVLERIAA